MSTDIELNASQAAVILGVTRQRVGQLAKAGTLPGRQIAGHYWVFSQSDVEALRDSTHRPGGRPPGSKTNAGSLVEVSPA